MLHPGRRYRANNGELVAIAGRVRNYDAERRPWVWSYAGDWYDERTGALVLFNRTRGHYATSSDVPRSISDHTEV